MRQTPEDDSDFGVEINRKGQAQCLSILVRRGFLVDRTPSDVFSGLQDLKQATSRYLAEFRAKSAPTSDEEGVEATCMAYFYLWLDAQLDSHLASNSGTEAVQ